AILLVVGTGSGVGYYFWSAGKQPKIVAQAVESAKAPLDSGEVNRAAGEYWLLADRSESAEEAQKAFVKARSELARVTANDGKAVIESGLLLIDLALAQVDLGGNDKQITKGRRLKWDAVQNEVRQTLDSIRAKEARMEGLRQVSRKLITRGE